ncbi:olfactory receptor 11H4 [Nannospalax galili]|nr:olfactory receptor 11H4 [Nannospalax galili]
MYLGPMNRSTHVVTEFVLLGFPGSWKIQIFLFLMFLVVYVLTLLGNAAIICAVRCDSRLHTPMYFLLGNFAFLEICYVSSTVPNMLANILSKTKAISFSGCFLQFYFFFSLGTTECLFLAVMAYDRYLAICRPLHYHTIMTERFCSILLSSCWFIGFLGYPVPIFFISQLPFCSSNIIDHFLCDMDPLMALSCAPAPITEIVFYAQSSFVLFFTIMYILRSYILLLRTVFRIPSAAGRQKAFSTCCSHLVVVSLFYGTVMVMYVSPTYGIPTLMQKVLTLVYSVMTPLFNPLIYSLRNKDMKLALRNVLLGTRITKNT